MVAMTPGATKMYHGGMKNEHWQLWRAIMSNSGEMGMWIVLCCLGAVAFASLVLGGLVGLVSGSWLGAIGGAMVPPIALWLWWNR
jgi:hypothetical protein